MYWRRIEDEGRDWREPERGPGRSDLGADWRGERESEHRGRHWRRRWAEREIWQAGPYAGRAHEYREQYWRSPGETPGEYLRPTGRRKGAYGGGWGREPRALRHHERSEEWGGAWPGWTYEQRPEYRAPKGYKRSDKRIMEDVCDAFMLDERLDPREIEVEVLDGVVILRGSVRHRHEKYLAEDIADSILGVKDVDNQVRIAQPGEVPHVARPTVSG